MKIWLFLFLLFHISGRAQTVSTTTTDFPPLGEDIHIPSTYVNGWIKETSGQKIEKSIMYRVKDGQILTAKNNQVFMVRSSSFGFKSDQGTERIFQFMNKPLIGFFEIMGPEKGIQFLVNYAVTESENTNYGDVKRKIQDLETNLFIKKGADTVKIKFKKKEIIKYFKDKPNLESFIKDEKIDIKSNEDLYKLVSFLNQ